VESLARELGLASSTVSRALNDYSDISEGTRRRVREAADRAGYRLGVEPKPAKAATNIVGLVVEIWSLDISSPFFGQFLRGATAALRRGGVDLLVASSDGPKEALKTYEYLIASNKVDGFILTRLHTEDPRLDLLGGRDVPFVCYGRDASPDDYAWHDVDAAEAATQSVARLVEKGHSRIGLVQAWAAINFVRLREGAFRAALADHGIEADDRLIVEAGLTAEDGAAAARRILELDEPPTALICDQDALAIGAMSAIRALGLVPGVDVSVIGYGNDPFSGYTEPPLSTFSQDAELAGRWVAEMMLATLSGTTPQILQRMRPAPFVSRRSVAAPTRTPAELRAFIDKNSIENPTETGGTMA
jgi:LacI family transcriptional regulator